MIANTYNVCMTPPGRRSATQLAAGLVFLCAGAGVFLAERAASQGSAKTKTGPAWRRVEYRPGGHFPAGFPLHGKVRLLSPPVVEMGQRHRIRVEYTAGDLPIETGMAIEVWKHFTSDVEEFQVGNSDAPAYFSVEFDTPAAKGRTKQYTNWVQRNEVSVFPYRKTAAVVIEQGRLKAGDKAYFDLGGPKGVRMQHYEENLFNFRFVITRDEKVAGYAGDAAMKVTGGPLRKLRVQAPSIVKAGEKFPVEIVPMDEWNSQAKNSTGLTFRIRSDEAKGGAFVYDPELLHYVAHDVTASGEGVLRIGVETTDGQWHSASNPVWVKKDPLQGAFFGELHQHSYLHDGRGVFDELYLYGRRVGLLDFGAVTPHHMPMSVTGPSFYLDKRYPVEAWPELQRATKRVNNWQGFVSVLGYEYSVGTPAGGHHNVFYNADQASSTMQLDRNSPAAPIGKMLETVKLARVPTLVIPHIGGGPPDWSHPTDPRIERLFEIASVHGVFEEAWQRHLRHGLRLGAIAAGDTHTTSMGIAYPGLIYVNTNGLTGVYAYGRSREHIWDGLYEKRTFATTGNQRILMDFRVNGEAMGGEVSSQMHRTARIEARVSGTAPILKLDLIKNNRPLYTLTPARQRSSLLRVIWGDNIYQRRAATGLRSGSLTPQRGRLRLRHAIHLDQAFEEVLQPRDGIVWTTAAVSNDRDGFLVDIAEAEGDWLAFELDDNDAVGKIAVRIPLGRLKQDGYFGWRKKAEKVEHSYMKMMEVEPAFFMECDLVDSQGTRDAELQYEDRETLKPGDYYYLRMEQLDTNKAWSSPVWVN